MTRTAIAATLAEKFTIVPNDIIRRPDITPRAFRVFVWLIANTAGGEMSANRIAQALDMSKDTARKALIDLEHLGYLRRAQVHNTDGTFSHIEYRLYFEPVDDTAPLTADIIVDSTGGDL